MRSSFAQNGLCRTKSTLLRNRVFGPVILCALIVACGPTTENGKGAFNREFGGKADTPSALTWANLVHTATNTITLSAEFANNGYQLPSNTFLLAARVVQGVEQPAFEFFSLGETGFTYSPGNFWPASTVKLMAAVGALMTLGEYGLTGAANVSFTDAGGSYSGTVKNLYKKAIVISENSAYDRLMRIAGFDEMNDIYLTPEAGFPKMVLQRRYEVGSNLRSSPAIAYQEGELSGQIPAREKSEREHTDCPNEANCTNLFELLEVMRKVTLHQELPKKDQFPLNQTDIDDLQQHLLECHSVRIKPGASAALGHSVKVYNKKGSCAEDDRLDHGLIVDQVTDEKYLIAFSMRYYNTSDADAAELTRQTLLALQANKGESPPLQYPAGIPVEIETTPNSEGCAAKITAPGADSIRAWINSESQPVVLEDNLTFELLPESSQIISVQALENNLPIGFQAFSVVCP
ncbi:MAG: serine hydrolase [Pseudomonadota bacterium]